MPCLDCRFVNKINGIILSCSVGRCSLLHSGRISGDNSLENPDLAGGRAGEGWGGVVIGSEMWEGQEKYHNASLQVNPHPQEHTCVTLTFQESHCRCICLHLRDVSLEWGSESLTVIFPPSLSPPCPILCLAWKGKMFLYLSGRNLPHNKILPSPEGICFSPSLGP